MGAFGIELNKERFLALLVSGAARGEGGYRSEWDHEWDRVGRSWHGFCTEMHAAWAQEKLIGESQHVQNNPPKFVPNESL